MPASEKSASPSPAAATYTTMFHMATKVPTIITKEMRRLLSKRYSRRYLEKAPSKGGATVIWSGEISSNQLFLQNFRNLLLSIPKLLSGGIKSKPLDFGGWHVTIVNFEHQDCHSSSVDISVSVIMIPMRPVTI